MILFLCNAEQACRLITLDIYEDNKSPEKQIMGKLCHSAIVYAIISGNTNMTVGDWTAKHNKDLNLLYLYLPYERINNLIAAILFVCRRCRCNHT
jgi:uncharacterized protein (DUF169 family)